MKTKYIVYKIHTGNRKGTFYKLGDALHFIHKQNRKQQQYYFIGEINE